MRYRTSGVATATVSAIIPVYNGARYVADSIRSVLEQSHEVAECIVVDDGSTDATPEVLASFGSSIIVVRQDHRGVSAARNAGMGAAGGDYFAFLDADDVWFPDKTAVQVDFMRSAPHAAATFSGFVITDQHLAWRRLVVHSGGPLSVRRAFLGRSSGLGFSFTGLVRREAVEVTGGFDERLSNCADVDFWWRLSRHRAVVGVRRPLALYRQHPYGQMHLDYERAEEEMAVVWAAAEGAGISRRSIRRAKGSLEAHVGARLLSEGRVAVGMDHVRAATGHHWRSVAFLPFASATRMFTQSVAAAIYRTVKAGERCAIPAAGERVAALSD